MVMSTEYERTLRECLKERTKNIVEGLRVCTEKMINNRDFEHRVICDRKSLKMREALNDMLIDASRYRFEYKESEY